MATINDYFKQSQLSQAAYGAGFTKGMFGGSFWLGLPNAGGGMFLFVDM